MTTTGIFYLCGRQCPFQRITLAEVPYFLTCLNAVVGNPVTFTIQFHEYHFHSLVAGAPIMAGHTTCSFISCSLDLRGRTVVSLYPAIEYTLHLTEHADIIGITRSEERRVGKECR